MVIVKRGIESLHVAFNFYFASVQGADPDIGNIVVCACLDVNPPATGCEPGNCQTEEAIQEIKDLLGVEAPQVQSWIDRGPFAETS